MNITQIKTYDDYVKYIEIQTELLKKAVDDDRKWNIAQNIKIATQYAIDNI